jgi:hypothetical protein
MKYCYGKISRLIGCHVRNLKFAMPCRRGNKSSSFDTLGSLKGRNRTSQRTGIDSWASPGDRAKCGVIPILRLQEMHEIDCCRSTLGSVAQAVSANGVKPEEHLQVRSRAQMIGRKYVVFAENMPLQVTGFVK